MNSMSVILFLWVTETYFRLKHFPWWRDLYRFKQGFMNIHFTDGKKYEALSKANYYSYPHA